jgi:TPP-dependent pyruvate/acetoin dehydrogenase alpha subunit
LELDKEVLLSLYRTMLTIRRFEERVSKEFHEGAIVGFVHSYVGQEAVAAGVIANLKRSDRIVSNHRGHGHCIAKGADLNGMMAEIYGKSTGYCKGKGGSMHIADFSIGMLGANGIVGAGLPIAAGAALAAQLEGKDRVAAVFFGDGASQEGEFHETLNLASIWKLPLVFVCENNFYGVNTPAQYAMGVADIARRALSYDMPGMVLDGNDVVAVYTAAHDAVARARAGNGPSLLECKTYRWHSHFEANSIPDLRPVEEIEAWKDKCPLANFELKLLEQGVLTMREVEIYNQQVQMQVDDAVDFAVRSPLPDPESALEDVFSA